MVALKPDGPDAKVCWFAERLTSTTYFSSQRYGCGSGDAFREKLTTSINKVPSLPQTMFGCALN